MKRFLTLLVILLIFTPSVKTNAQELSTTKEKRAYKKRHPIYGFKEVSLSNTDTISGYDEQEEKLKISGTIYQSDGVTPAKNIIFYICQPDDYGDYGSKKINGKRVLKYQACIKTDDDGHYTFYTFVPGTYWPSRSLQEIHGVIKTPDNTKEYAIEHFIFDNDPLLRRSCRKKIEKRGLKNILKLEKKDNMLVGRRDIVLKATS
ncbi:hypothetical protein MHTCC0001_21170 [Flavobacteriaceae bacterium MHTCC 0001]